MAKTSGIGWTKFEVDDGAGAANDLKNDVLSLDISTPRAVIDVTGLDKGAMERILGLADATVSGECAFNPALSHATFRTVASGTNARTVSIEHSSQTLAMEMLLTTYDLGRGNDGKVTGKFELVLADGTAPTWGP
jgi:hypothetical protein